VESENMEGRRKNTKKYTRKIWKVVESGSMERTGKDGEILVGSGEERRYGRKRKGWRDIGKIWRGADMEGRGKDGE
jgi:hypothetical protein